MVDTINSDGLLIRFGNDQGRRANTSRVTTDTTKHNELVLFVTLTGAARTIYPGNGLSRFTGNDTPIPAGAYIVSERVIVTETPVGGTNYSVGTFNLDGSTINAAGIRTTGGTDGTSIGTQVNVDNYVAAVTTGTYTAGKVKIVITYVIR